MKCDVKGWFGCLIIAMICLSHSVGIAQIDEHEEARRIAEYFAEPEILKLPGNYLKAILEAYKDFQKNIMKEKSNIGRFGSKVDDYFITISKKQIDHNYRIWFQLKPFNGNLLKGGGATYIIDGESFKIIERKYGM